MRRTALTNVFLGCAICGLAACGGGGGGGSGFNSTPPPPSTKTCPDGSVIPADQVCPPSPPQPTYPIIFPSITQSTDFAVLGIQADTAPTTISALTTAGFAVSFDAATGAYIIDLPSAEPGKFIAQSVSNRTWDGYIDGGTYASFYIASVFKPSPTNPDIQLSHTSFAQFFNYDYDDNAPIGFVAFGTATPAGSIPTTGSATMDAIVAGLTLDGTGAVGGAATLQFDFGAGTLAGHFDPVLTLYNSAGLIPLGSYTFVNTVFGIGSTTFSGNFSHANPLLTGAFNGLFTGPNAQELMARWTADYVNPATQQQGEMFGVWVGKGP